MAKNYDIKIVGQRIKMLRGNTTQKNFAETLGFHQTKLSQVELGNQKPSLNMLFAISATRNTSIDFILTGEDEPPPITEKVEKAVEGYMMTIKAQKDHNLTQGEYIKVLKGERSTFKIEIIALKAEIAMLKNDPTIKNVERGTAV